MAESRVESILLARGILFRNARDYEARTVTELYELQDRLSDTSTEAACFNTTWRVQNTGGQRNINANVKNKS